MALSPQAQPVTPALQSRDILFFWQAFSVEVVQLQSRKPLTTEITEDTEKEGIAPCGHHRNRREVPRPFRPVSSRLSPWSPCSPWFKSTLVAAAGRAAEAGVQPSPEPRTCSRRGHNSRGSRLDSCLRRNDRVGARGSAFARVANVCRAAFILLEALSVSPVRSRPGGGR